MPISKHPFDLATIPSQLVTGICLDCDCTRFVNSNGKCTICGSNSIIKRGAIKELREQIKLHKLEN